MLAAGIDIGTETVKAVILSAGKLLAYSLLGGENHGAEEMVLRCLDDAAKKASLPLAELGRIAYTGLEIQGLPVQASYLREPLCLSRGLSAIAPGIGALLDIGAQKYTAIRCRSGFPRKIATNDKCALGTGRYLKMVSEILGVPLEKMGETAAASRQSVEVLSTCAVFAESEVISLIHRKNRPEDILAGVLRGLAARIYGTVLAVDPQGEMALVGGVAKNQGVRRALAEKLKAPFFIPEEPQIIGAWGAALLVQGKKEG